MATLAEESQNFDLSKDPNDGESLPAAGKLNANHAYTNSTSSWNGATASAGFQMGMESFTRGDGVQVLCCSSFRRAHLIRNLRIEGRRHSS